MRRSTRQTERCADLDWRAEKVCRTSKSRCERAESRVWPGLLQTYLWSQSCTEIGVRQTGHLHELRAEQSRQKYFTGTAVHVGIMHLVSRWYCMSVNRLMHPTCIGRAVDTTGEVAPSPALRGRTWSFSDSTIHCKTYIHIFQNPRYASLTHSPTPTAPTNRANNDRNKKAFLRPVPLILEP